MSTSVVSISIQGTSKESGHAEGVRSGRINGTATRTPMFEILNSPLVLYDTTANVDLWVRCRSTLVFSGRFRN